jgi:hypothetical protein
MRRAASIGVAWCALCRRFGGVVPLAAPVHRRRPQARNGGRREVPFVMRSAAWPLRGSRRPDEDIASPEHPGRRRDPSQGHPDAQLTGHRRGCSRRRLMLSRTRPSGAKRDPIQVPGLCPVRSPEIVSPLNSVAERFGARQRGRPAFAVQRMPEHTEVGDAGQSRHVCQERPDSAGDRCAGPAVRAWPSAAEIVARDDDRY